MLPGKIPTPIARCTGLGSWTVFGTGCPGSGTLPPVCGSLNGNGGTLTAGLFLQEFVTEGTAWAHLDIAGPAWSEEVDAEIPKGGTGFGVRTLIDWLS